MKSDVTAITNAFVITERIPMPSRIPYQMPVQQGQHVCSRKNKNQKCLKYCMIWNSFPHCTRCFYVVFIQESLIKKTFSYWTVRPHHCESHQRKIRYTHWFNEALNCPWNFARMQFILRNHIWINMKKKYFSVLNYSIELIFLQIMSVVYTMYGCCPGLGQNPHCSHSKL